MTERQIGVVGAGIVGLAIARALALRFPADRVIVFEKEESVARHQTSHNSGVVHAGLYYKPGSLKAQLCSAGRSMLREYCVERGIAYQERGKLVVAVDSSELARLGALEVTAKQNQVPGLCVMSGDSARELEPRIRSVGALYSPRTAITDFPGVARSLAADVVAMGGQVRLQSPVIGIRQGVDDVQVHLEGRGTEQVSHLVVCAGLQADRVSRWADQRDGPRIIPFRGEYLAVRPGPMRQVVSAMIYPVPDPRYPFLGVHFTPTIQGALEIGPNAVLSLDRESYGIRPRIKWADLRSTMAWPGTWRMASRHWATGVGELYRSAWLRAAIRNAQRYVPEITAADVVRSRVGIRAQAVERNGDLTDDFVVSESGRVTGLRNAPSPAATSALAIAEHVVSAIAIR